MSAKKDWQMDPGELVAYAYRLTQSKSSPNTGEMTQWLEAEAQPPADPMDKAGVPPPSATANAERGVRSAEYKTQKAEGRRRKAVRETC